MSSALVRVVETHEDAAAIVWSLSKVCYGYRCLAGLLEIRNATAIFVEHERERAKIRFSYSHHFPHFRLINSKFCSASNDHCYFQLKLKGQIMRKQFGASPRNQTSCDVGEQKF